MEKYNFKKIKRIVIKVGSSTLANEKGLIKERFQKLAQSLAQLKENKLELLIVSSGAIVAGQGKMPILGSLKNISHKQAYAAIGQADLMSYWEKPLAKYNIKVAQILLSAFDLDNRTRFLNARNTLNTLLEWQIIPIVNENDTVATAEIKVGDNDTLGALVAALVEADLFINLTDTQGLYDDDPQKNPQAKLINEVKTIDDTILNLAKGSSSQFGTGGMYTKVRAAKRLSEQGIASIIAHALEDNVLEKIVKQENVGTFFHPQVEILNMKKSWLAFAALPKGKIIVDEGAQKAIVEHGKSLLPSGIISSFGHFSQGDPLSILNQSEELIAVGLSNYNQNELEKIKGLQSNEIEKKLGYTNSDEIIHRNNMVLSAGLI